MGCDCTTYFPKGTKPADVEEFLLLLGFQRGRKGAFSGVMGTPYSYYKDEDYKYITGLYSEIYRDKADPEQILLWTRTTIWRSKFDSDFHNYAIRQLRKRFGGYFISDYGRNRYFQFDGPVREKAEAGVYSAFSYFHSNIKRGHRFIDFANLFDENKYKFCEVDFIDAHNPKILSANIMVPFLVSATEDFFRSAYVALLRYSPNRERIVKNARLQGSDIAAVDKGELTVLDAVAKWMSFQDLNKINIAYKEIDSRYDIHGILRRPSGRQRFSSWDVLSRLIRQRHELIHQSELNIKYRPAQLVRDIDRVCNAIWCVYQELIKINNWVQVEKREFLGA